MRIYDLRKLLHCKIYRRVCLYTVRRVFEGIIERETLFQLITPISCFSVGEPVPLLPGSASYLIIPTLDYVNSRLIRSIRNSSSRNN